jgi:hypothetical protein
MRKFSDLKRSARVAVITTMAIGGLLAGIILAPVHSDPQPANKPAATGDKVTPVSSDAVILEASLKSASPQDYDIRVSLECSINTALITDVSGEHQEASATVKVWATFDGDIVPINSINPSKTSPQVGDDSDKVTFCNRTYGRTVTDQDGNGTIDSEDDFIATKTSHSFEWIRLNAGSGTHFIKIHADFTTAATSKATATAQVGNRILVVDPQRYANNASI